MKYSSMPYPLGLDIVGALQKAWEEGWLDDFSEEHFLIKAIRGRLTEYQGYQQLLLNNSSMCGVSNKDFQVNFVINFSGTLILMEQAFGETKVKNFIENQLSAGKGKYDEAQFFRALSEMSIIRFWLIKARTGEYEPQTNGKKNPEARFQLSNGLTVDVEVKTPGFQQTQGIKEYVIPLALLADKGRELRAFCAEHNLTYVPPRVQKLKEFLNNAAEKFVAVDHKTHINLLYINWTFSEYPEISYLEAFGLLANPDNGLLANKEMGRRIGVNKEVYDKITAVIVYTESLNGLMFGDFRYVWTRSSDGFPHFAFMGLHQSDLLHIVTGMNEAREVPAVLYVAGEQNHLSEIMSIVNKHIQRL